MCPLEQPGPLGAAWPGLIHQAVAQILRCLSRHSDIFAFIHADEQGDHADAAEAPDVEDAGKPEQASRS